METSPALASAERGRVGIGQAGRLRKNKVQRLEESSAADKSKPNPSSGSDN